MHDNKIVNLDDYKRQKILKVYNQLPPAVKEYVKGIDKDFQYITDISFDELPEDFDLDEILSILDDME